jgi:NAD(P)-dependent dehydrogenase (short-subunit alcohol dehydrogenase family)
MPLGGPTRGIGFAIAEPLGQLGRPVISSDSGETSSRRP